MLTAILLVLAGLVAGLLLAAVRLPDTMQLQRSIRIDAPAAKVFPLLDDLRASEQWSPFMRKDPAMKSTYSGPARGPGAQLDFAGNRDIGSGRVTVLECVAPTRVVLRLQMFTPMAADNVVTFSVLPLGDHATEVTWNMTGPQPVFGRLLCLLLKMDDMVGRDFDTGLRNLKNLVEQR